MVEKARQRRVRGALTGSARRCRAAAAMASTLRTVCLRFARKRAWKLKGRTERSRTALTSA